jgi:hypothetical protein
MAHQQSQPVRPPALARNGAFRWREIQALHGRARSDLSDEFWQASSTRRVVIQVITSASYNLVTLQRSSPIGRACGNPTGPATGRALPFH